jgi:hypothetical protein
LKKHKIECKTKGGVRLCLITIVQAFLSSLFFSAAAAEWAVADITAVDSADLVVVAAAETTAAEVADAVTTADATNAAMSAAANLIDLQTG